MVAAAALAIALLAVLAGSWTYSSREAGEVEREASRQLQVIANLKLDQLRMWRAERMGDAEVLAHRAGESNPLAPAENGRPERAEAFLSWLRSYVGAYADYDQGVLLDAEGRPQLAFPPEVALPPTVVDAARGVVASGQPQILDFYIDEQDRLSYMALLVPVRDAVTDGAPIGALVLRITPAASLAPIIDSSAGNYRTFGTRVVRREGDAVVLVHDHDVSNGERIPLTATHRLAVKAVRGQTGQVDGEDYRGVPLFAWAVEVPEFNWVLLTYVQIRELDGLKTQRVEAVPLVVGLLLLATGAIAVLVAGGQRLRSLSRQAELAGAVADREQRLTLALEASGLALFEIDPQAGRIISASPGFTAMLGYPPDAVEQPTSVWNGRIHPDDRNAQLAAYEACLEGHTDVYRGQFRMQAADGTWKWISSVARVVARTPAGQPLRVIGSHTDITGFRTTQATLDQTVAKLQRLLNSSPTVVYRTTLRDGQPVAAEISDNVQKILGYALEDAMRPGFWEAHAHPDDVAPTLARLARLATEDDILAVYRFRHANGHYVWVEDRMAVQQRVNGAPTEMVGAWNDVTERVLADEALKASEARLRLAMTAARQGLFDLNLTTGDAIVSTEYAEMLGYDPATFTETNHRWMERMHPEDVERTVAALQALIAGEASEYRVQFRQRTSAGDWKWILSVGQVVERDAWGRPTRMLGTHTDISVEKAAERALLDSEERLRRTADTLNHLLSNSPTVIYSLTLGGGEVLPLRISDNVQSVLGYSVAEALDPAWWPQHVHPEDRSRAFGVLTQLNVMAQVTHEFRFQRKDGSWVWLEDTTKVVKRTGDGAALEIVGSWNDITVRKRAELQVERLTRLYATLSLCNEAIVRSTSEVDLFPRICEAAVRAGGFSMAWIGMLDPSSGEVRPVAVYGEGSEFPHRAGISVDPDVPGGIGPTGTAVRTGQPSWFEDLADAPESAAWRDLVRPFGWQAAAALPLKRDGETVAALTIYSTEAQVFDEPRRRLLVEMAADISFALGSFKRDAEFRDAVVQLRQSETRYRAIFQQTGVPMLLLDVETAAIADANAAASRFYGWDHETLCRMYVDDINVLSREQVLPHLQKAAASTQTRFRFTHRLASGERREIESFTAPVVIDGRDRVVSIITDVTARKQAEAAVREKELLLVEAQRFARMGSWTLSQNGHRVWSAEMFRLFGLPAGSPTPTPEETLAMVHPDDRARLAATAAGVWQHRQLADVTYRIVRPDGTLRHVLTRAEYSDDPVHGPTLSGTTQDITEQHEAERQLRVKNLAIETSINGVVLGDLEGRLTYANAAALRMWGYASAEEVQGRPLTEFWEDPSRAATALAKVEALGAFTGELRARQASGEVFDALVSSSLVRDTEDRPVCIFAAIVDITARKQAEGDLRRSLSEKEALLREVHHRVKNNLQIVSSLLRLEVGRSSDPGLREAFTEMQTRILSMALLHETLYRADDFASVDLSVYLSRLVQHVFRAMAPSSGRVTLQLDLQPARVELDQAVPCGLIVSELVSNSLKHGFPGDRAGAVHVRVGILPDGRVALSVGDDGVGLPGDYHERASRSLGMQLVEDLTRQLHAEATVDTTGGSSYSIFFTPRALRGGAPLERPPATA